MKGSHLSAKFARNKFFIEGYLLSKLYELPPQEFRTQKILLSVVPLIE
jgi:hypothetical protein